MIASKPHAPATPFEARETRLLGQITIFTLALGCTWALALNLVDPDLWGHVRYAEDWLATGELPRTASHTFSAGNHRWINHENLAELSLALGYRYLGVGGLLTAKCLTGLGILLAMVWVARRNEVHALVAWTAMTLIAANLHPFFLLRPQLFSFALCALTLVLIETSFCSWHENRSIRWRPLMLLPVVFAAWANTHGAFLAGLCIVGAYLLGRTVELLFTGYPQSPSRSRQAAVKLALALLVIALSTFAATLANPYGPELHRRLVQSLIQPRPEITEWASPSLHHIVFWPWITLLTTTGLSLLLTRERRDWVKLVILALVAWQAALHMRHIAFFALLCGFWVPLHLQSAASRIRFELPLVPWFRRTALIVLLVCIGGLSFGIDRQLGRLPVARSAYPLDAVQFMADRGLQGKLVVSFNWAQYAVAALAPDVQVAFDGRFRTCYPQEVVDMHFDFLLGEFGGRRSRSPNSGPIDATRTLEHGSPDLVLLDRHYDNAVDTMQDNPAWVLLFRDRVAEVWGRRERYDDPLGKHYFPLALRVQDPKPREGAVQWPALPERNEDSQLADQNARDVRQAVEL